MRSHPKSPPAVEIEDAAFHQIIVATAYLSCKNATRPQILWTLPAFTRQENTFCHRHKCHVGFAFPFPERSKVEVWKVSSSARYLRPVGHGRDVRPSLPNPGHNGSSAPDKEGGCYALSIPNENHRNLLNTASTYYVYIQQLLMYDAVLTSSTSLVMCERRLKAVCLNVGQAATTSFLHGLMLRH